MANYLALVNGVPRQSVLPGTQTIYDQSLTIVASGATGSNQMNGPVASGASVTLPASQTYTGAELNVYLNGDRLESVFDYVYVGTGSTKTQIQFTFGLVVGDRVDFRIDRSP